MSSHNDSANKAFHAQIIAQWITSLAISVICCAILFIVFAVYVVELHDTNTLLSIKIELLQEKYTQLQSEITYMNRQIAPKTPPAIVETPPANSETQMPAPALPEGVELNENGGNLGDEAKDDLMPVLDMTGTPPKTPQAPVKKEHAKP